MQIYELLNYGMLFLLPDINKLNGNKSLNNIFQMLLTKLNGACLNLCPYESIMKIFVNKPKPISI